MHSSKATRLRLLYEEQGHCMLQHMLNAVQTTAVCILSAMHCQVTDAAPLRCCTLLRHGEHLFVFQLCRQASSKLGGKCSHTDALHHTLPPHAYASPASCLSSMTAHCHGVNCIRQGCWTLVIMCCCRRDVVGPLADHGEGCRVIAFDRPPYGLSERPLTWPEGPEGNPYTSEVGPCCAECADLHQLWL